MTETQQRFLRAIGERLPTERVVELYLFPPMRQGTQESGVAVIAALRQAEGGANEAAAAAPSAEPAGRAPLEETSGEACDPTEDASRDEPSAASDEPAAPPASAPPARHTVFTARYRYTLKGPERGKWELSIVEEADAPLLTIEMVVRGVQRRTGDGAEPERVDPATLRELLAAPAA